MPMFLQGLTGISRRMANGGYDYAHAKEVLYLNEINVYFCFWSFCISIVFYI